MNNNLDANSSFKPLDLFQFAVMNPQIAMLSFLKVGQLLATQPKKIQDSHRDLLNRLMELQKKFTAELCEQKNSVTLSYNTKENKFDDSEFANNKMILFAKQFYETTSQWALDTLNSMENIDHKLAHSASFFLKQYIYMMSPNNFPFLNPEVLEETVKTNGDNFREGFDLFLKDIQEGHISTTDKEKFKIGQNIASTSGKVVYQNYLFELIQYSPTTKKVFAKPILFVPPWINKFYILDLDQESSFVKWTVDKGCTVFMISWINPDKRYKDCGFDKYIFDGLLEAIDKIYDITHSKSVHTFGYCVGSTLISCFLAYIASKKNTKVPKAKIESATLLTTLLNFEQAGDMSIFMADNYLEAINIQLENSGMLDGSILYNTFSTLKSKDMIWRYFINNYMLGKKPEPHPILFWNTDHTNLTKSMQLFLAKDLYRDNLLKAGTFSLRNISIDFSLVKKPIYMISTLKDHLVPWQASYDSIKLLKNSCVKFVLGGSGHVAGIINPPNKNKYYYKINDKIYDTAEEWINTSTEIAGSWWNHWFEWVSPMMGKLVTPPPIKDFLRNAPGIYVFNKRPKNL